MAHEYVMNYMASPDCKDTTISNIVSVAWSYADLMQDEADKRNYSEKQDSSEWQPDWSQAPEWANWWVIGSLTKQGVWSETKPVCVKFNGVNYWEVGSPSGEEHLSVAPSFDYQGNWQNSLRKRPQ